MKRLFPIAVLLLVLISACSSNELPPPPPPIGGGGGGVGSAIAGMASGLPTWAAQARNVAVTPPSGTYGDSVILTVSNFDYIYSNGYLFNAKSRVWERFSLQGDQVKEWIKNQGIANVPLDSSKFVQGDNYLVIYACTKTGSEWECNNKKWMLVTVTVTAKAGTIPESAFINQFVINDAIAPFAVMNTAAENDNFTDTGKTDPMAYVIRYDARYREPKGLAVLVHIFDFKDHGQLDSVVKSSLFKDIITQGWQVYQGNNVALFLGDNHRIALWTSGKELIYIETYQSDSANKEIIEGYLKKYPSDLKKT